MLSPLLLNKLEVFDSWENFGLAPPIGSRNFEFSKWSSTNLNAGIGEPWAGQVKAIPLLKYSVNVRESNFEANFGLADPIGSTKTSNVKLYKD